MSETLEIERKEYGSRLKIGNESYFIKDEGNGVFHLIIENEEKEMIDVVPDRYENLGDKDLQELLCKTITDPSEMLKMLIEEELEIEKIVVEFD